MVRIIWTLFDSEENTMRRTIILAVIACILGIVILAALAFYIPNRLGRSQQSGQSEEFTGFQFATERPEQEVSSSEEEGPHPDTSETAPSGDTVPEAKAAALPDTETAVDQTEEAGGHAVQYSALPSTVKEHRIIWVGDSRTLGLRDALHKTERPDDDLFVGQVGEGVRWFRETGMAELSDVIAENPGLPVVMNFGVNDPQLVNDYVVAYWDVIRAHPDTHFYILSVNPLDEEFLIEDGQVNESVFDDINSLNVGRMNVKLKKEFKNRYIDSASFLKTDGFGTVDGLHFDTQTYLKIHDYVVSLLF